jgi:tRNA U38,U39,U40 pseudouridine synthase TruA
MGLSYKYNFPGNDHRTDALFTGGKGKKTKEQEYDSLQKSIEQLISEKDFINFKALVKQGDAYNLTFGSVNF